MAAGLDPRQTALLEVYRIAGEPYAPSIATVDQAFDRPKPDPTTVAHVPDRAAQAVRIVLLERVVAHEYSMGHGLGAARVALSRRRLPPDPDGLEVELALIRAGTTFEPGVRLGALRLHLLDPVLEDLERSDVASLRPTLVGEIERTVEHLSADGLADEQDAYDRRPRLISALHAARPAGLSPLAFDPGDGYGIALRALVASDDRLAADLLPAYRLVARAGSILPTARWNEDAEAAIAASGASLRDAVIRSIRPALDVRPPANVSLPGMPGALRITNQRFLRGSLWLVATLDPEWATQAFADLGIFFGTSGRNDNTARDAAIASTCAALLGQRGTPSAQVALARMKARITNRPVSKQIDAALGAATTAAPPFAEPPLPTFDLDPDGRRRIVLGEWSALVEVRDDRISTTWLDPAGSSATSLPPGVEDAHAGDAASVRRLVKSLRAGIAEERGRLEDELLVGRAWPFDAWRERWLDHPIGGKVANRLVWRFETGSGRLDGMSLDRAIVDVDGRPFVVDAGASVRLWHPVEADPEAVTAWQARLGQLAGGQPLKQVDREVFRADPDDREAILDRRFAGSVVDQTRLRAVMRSRGWRGPLVGSWDGGAKATIERAVPGTDWRAELDLTGSGSAARDGFASVRLGSVRFMAGRGPDGRPAPIVRVPPRFHSEALRDVHLFTSPATAERVG